MGTEITRLDCVYGASVEALRTALGTPPRTLSIYSEGEWLVIVDEDRLAEMNWAEMASRALGVRGVSIRAYSDYGDVTVVVFESGHEVGRFAMDENTERDDDDWLKVALPALGVSLDVGGNADDIALAIANAAKLPRPLSRYDAPPADAIELPPGAVAEASSAAPRASSPPGAGTVPRSGARFDPPSSDEPSPAEPSADELAAFGAFLDVAERAPPREIRTSDREPELPPLPGRLHDRAAFENFLGREWAVGRIRWRGAPTEDVTAALIALGDGFVANYGDDVLGIDFRVDGRVVRVGGPLASSTSTRGAAIWTKIRPHFGSAATLRLRGAEFAFEHDVRQGETVLAWSAPLPPHAPMVAALSACFDAVIRRAVALLDIAEAFVVAQGQPGEPAYARMCGVRSLPAIPAWRVFVAPDLIASPAPSPFAMTADEMNRLAKELLPKQKR